MPLPSGLIICFLSKSRFLQTHFCDQSQSHCPYCQLGRAPVLTAAYTGHSHPCSCCFLDNPALFWFSRHISLWGSISFNLAVFINLAVALFYPFGDDGDEGKCLSFCKRWMPGEKKSQKNSQIAFLKSLELQNKEAQFSMNIFSVFIESVEVVSRVD